MCSKSYTHTYMNLQMIYMCMSALYVLCTRICVRDVKLIDSVIDKHRLFFLHYFFNSKMCDKFQGRIHAKLHRRNKTENFPSMCFHEDTAWQQDQEEELKYLSGKQRRGKGLQSEESVDKWTRAVSWTTKLQNVAADRDEMMEGRKQGPSHTENTILSCYDEYLTLK